MKARHLIPLAIFLALAVLLAAGLGLNPRSVPSPLVGQPAPAFSLPGLKAPERPIGLEDLRGRPVTLVNVWASWCSACRLEHPFLLDLARRGELTLFGINYKDERAAALRWLEELGDPYAASGFDQDGRVGIDWGVYGVPETFVVDGDGIIRHKVTGPITPEIWQREVKPLIDELGAR